MNNSKTPPLDWSALCAQEREPVPGGEWWFALPQNQNDAARLESIHEATKQYKARFGCPPADVPRVVMVGKVPVLAYAPPVIATATAWPKTIIVEEQPPLQMSLL